MSDLFAVVVTPEMRAAVIAELRQQAELLAPAGRNAFPGMCGTMHRSGHSHPEALGLYDEDDTLKRVRAVFRRMLDAAEGVELYQPSNGTEGECFMSQWCANCTADANFDPVTGAGEGCEILASTMISGVDDDDYPRQWRSDGEKGPRCTAFEQRTTIDGR